MERENSKRSMWSDQIVQNFRNSEYRKAFVENSIKSILARQIRILREEHGLSQADLASRLDTKQSTVSRLENPENGSVTLNTLLNLASLFDVALKVEFSQHEDLLDRMSKMTRQDLCVSPYDESRLAESCLLNNTLCWIATDSSRTISSFIPSLEGGSEGKYFTNNSRTPGTLSVGSHMIKYVAPTTTIGAAFSFAELN